MITSLPYPRKPYRYRRLSHPRQQRPGSPAFPAMSIPLLPFSLNVPTILPLAGQIQDTSSVPAVSAAFSVALSAAFASDAAAEGDTVVDFCCSSDCSLASVSSEYGSFPTFGSRFVAAVEVPFSRLPLLSPRLGRTHALDRTHCHDIGRNRRRCSDRR